jgi:SprT-like family protein
VSPRRAAVVLPLLALGLTLLVSGCSDGRDTGRSSRAAVRALSPEQARGEELFRLNANLPSDPALASAYQAINTGYFEGRLPAIGIRWEPRLSEIGPLIAAGFQMDGMTNGRQILMNPALQNDDEQLRRTLCHEIVHVAVKGQTTEEHGPVFQNRLRQLAEQGAFTGTVATEEEKQELRRTVETRLEELKKEAEGLSRARSEVSSDLQRIDYNFSVQRHNNAVEDLNRMIEQYNLMLSYPDGLDRERMIHRPPVAEVR